MPPENRQTKHPPPRWAVRLGSEQIRVIEQWRVPSATATFYRATAAHPGIGKPIPLEPSTDLAERVDKVLTAWCDPDCFARRNSWDCAGEEPGCGVLRSGICVRRCGAETAVTAGFLGSMTHMHACDGHACIVHATCGV